MWDLLAFIYLSQEKVYIGDAYWRRDLKGDISDMVKVQHEIMCKPDVKVQECVGKLAAW